MDNSLADEENGSHKHTTAELPWTIETTATQEFNWRRFIGTAPDVDPTNPVEVEQAQYAPDRYLAGKLSQAIDMSVERGSAVRFDFSQGAITVSAEHNQAWVSLRESKLESLALLPLVDEKSGFSFVDDFSATAEPPGATAFHLGGLLWITTLFASRGRLPAGTRIDTNVGLPQRPDLAHLADFPNLDRIVDLLCARPSSLVDVASLLGIPLRFVFAFYSGAMALGWFDPPRSGANVDGDLLESETRSNTRKPNRKLFRRVLTRGQSEPPTQSVSGGNE